METFIGDLSDIRDCIGKRLSKHINELNETCTIGDISKMYGITIGVISTLNTKNYSRISLPTILETAEKLEFTYSFSVTNENGVSEATCTITLNQKYNEEI